MSRYDDIIDAKHEKSPLRAHMTRHDRAAQFASFAALDGHAGSIRETARLTDDLSELSDDELFDLSVKMQILSDNIGSRPEIDVNYFIRDERKSGGRYVTDSGCLRVIDRYSRELVFTDGRKIPMDNIVFISGDIFENFL